MEYKAIQTNEYLTSIEIEDYLFNVEFIILAAPAPDKFTDTPIHFTLFLNTDAALPKEIEEAVLSKFLADHSISRPKELLARLMPVGFAKTTQDTFMPMLLIKPEDRGTIPHVPLFVYDFLADSDMFLEVKEKSLTGWSYSYTS
ncbi:MAG: hypothetical protein RBR59_09045 [Sulfurimonadaceae bacterium]|jgi:hypothetical protein|nr:hypothetical protein [Sulfurimonadaceae bacterium]